MEKNIREGIIKSMLGITLGIQVYEHGKQIKDITTIIGIIIGALIITDGISGVAHWAVDSYGKANWPIIGKTIKAFRDHHIVPTSMTTMSFYENNEENMIIALGIQYIAIIINSWYTKDQKYRNEIQLGITCIAGLIAITNQIHAWCHTTPEKLPILVNYLQQIGIIINGKGHQKHHQSKEKDTYYCITTGWLNKPLETIAFWRTLETIIYHITATQPREEDKQWAFKK
mmetsp:Transcript_9526/g.14077  ORF Transcript_9526/g.14077 Transcript_9526/m.14077 type:complete len:229 (+) Transcript_9526:36-722(+)